jgi:hypothetical protein
MDPSAVKWRKESWVWKPSRVPVALRCAELDGLALRVRGGTASESQDTIKLKYKPSSHTLTTFLKVSLSPSHPPTLSPKKIRIILKQDPNPRSSLD